MNKLKQFYETTEQRVPFNELSDESMDILEQSAAYKRWFNNDLRRAKISIKMSKIRSLCRLQDTQNKAMDRWVDNLKYIGNVILCATAALLLVMLFLNEMIKHL